MTTTDDHPTEGEGGPEAGSPDVAAAVDEHGGGGDGDSGDGPGEETRPHDYLAPGTPEYIEDPSHYGIYPGERWPDDVPHGQNDMHWRFEGDEKGARRAELRIAACWMVTLLSGIGLATVYVVGGQPQAEGSMLFTGFAGLGIGLILWARDLLPGNDVTASRGPHHAVSPESARRTVVQSLGRGLEPMARRPFLGKMLGAVGTVFGIGILFPLASLGPRVTGELGRTPWRHGMRVLNEDGYPVKPGDVLPNGILTVFPDTGLDPSDPSQAQASTILINLGTAILKTPADRQSWHIGGIGSGNCIVAFSKICTHAGCPVGLYNVQAHQLICPCHQSTFDVLSDCKPVFGPAPRSLPQLPLTTDSDGYIIAQSDYTVPVGPGYWNRS